MKLRNILLSAELFLFAGIASAVAEDPADEDARRETIYITGAAVPEAGNNYMQYFLDTAGNGSLGTALFRYDGAAATEDVGYAAGYEKDDANEAFHDDPASADNKATDAGGDPGETGMTAPAESRPSGSDGLHAYDFALSYDYSITPEIGFTGREEGADNSDSAIAEPAASDDSRVPDKGPQSVLVFEKNAFKNGQINAQLIENDSRLEDSEEEGGILSLSGPIALLLVGVGIGIVLVMHTVTENKSS